MYKFIEIIFPNFFKDREAKTKRAEDLESAEDHRENKDEDGILAACFYCGTDLRVDGWGCLEDYEVHENTIHCEECFSAAIRNLC